MINIILDERTGEAEIFIDCNGIGQCPTAAYFELEERWKKEGLEFEPTPGKGPFDFKFQVKQQSGRKHKRKEA